MVCDGTFEFTPNIRINKMETCKTQAGWHRHSDLPYLECGFGMFLRLWIQVPWWKISHNHNVTENIDICTNNMQATIYRCNRGAKQISLTQCINYDLHMHILRLTLWKKWCAWIQIMFFCLFYSFFTACYLANILRFHGKYCSRSNVGVCTMQISRFEQKKKCANYLWVQGNIHDIWYDYDKGEFEASPYV